MLNKILKTSFLFLFLLLWVSPNMAQDKQEPEQKIEIPSSVKEELHRYMGYEELLPKYISLSYDVTMNTNVRGSFLDLSFLFLMFLPILLIIGLKNNWIKFGAGVLMLLFFVIGNPTSFSSYTNTFGVHRVSVSNLNNKIAQDLAATSFSQHPLTFLKLKISQVANNIYSVLDQNIFQKFSGEGDSITYPFFFLLFVTAFFLLTKRMSGKPKGEQALVYLGLLYCFMWLILGAGVPWYGILMVALGLIYITVGFLGNSDKLSDVKTYKYLFLGVAAFWLVISFTFRMANYLPESVNDRPGAIHTASLFYGLGKKDKNEVLDYLFPAYRPVVEDINGNPNALVYRAGTYFQYFIDRNIDRVTHDNQLEFFNDLVDRIPNKVTLAKALKKSGYEYMLIDINLAGIDATPEKSLERKARRLNEFLINNPALEPLGTDRVIQLPNGQFSYGFSGGKVQNNGSFIAFKIK